jgi:pimeloyl-ACP methyl ester carboxylesterase
MTLLSQRLSQTARARGVRHNLQIMQVQTAYWHYPAEIENAPTIVLIHGYRGNHHGLEAIAGGLAKFNLIIPDLPGFGSSEPLQVEHSIENYSWWLGEFLANLGLTEKPHLLGHSFGSIVVSHHAAHGANIRTLILENPVSAPALKGPNAPITAVAQSFFKLAELLPNRAGLGILKSWPMVRGMSILMTKSWRRTLRKWVHAQHDENFNDFANRKVAIEGYRASISHCVAEYSPSFAVPTLVLIGSKDDITSPKQQAAMVKTIKTEHELVEFAGVGHLTHYEIPDLIAESIAKFVAHHENR